ncbi:MAG: hypothetical protein JRI36_06255 [Deltaproteobacteria bacterium]|nr:hypothetical protein [Deltaproteobacteria bacterium]
MFKGYMKDRIKKELESMGERAGKRIGETIANGADEKAARIGKKVGKKVASGVERIHDALEKESVSKKEQLGLGGKLGTGIGIIGKNLVEKRYGVLARLAGSNDLVSQGRTLGAKAEKLVKRAVKAKLEQITEKTKKK